MSLSVENDLLVARRRREDWMHGRLVEHYLRHTALKTEEEVCGRLLCEVDTFLTPDEAVELGIADRIQRNAPATLREWKEIA